MRNTASPPTRAIFGNEATRFGVGSFSILNPRGCNNPGLYEATALPYRAPPWETDEEKTRSAGRSVDSRPESRAAPAWPTCDLSGFAGMGEVGSRFPTRDRESGVVPEFELSVFRDKKNNAWHFQTPRIVERVANDESGR